MGLLDSESIPRRTMVLFFIVDTSGSMSGSKIGTANTAIAEIIPGLSDISKENADAQIKIAVLEFSSGAKWLYEKPIEAESFRWNDLSAGGITDFGEACKMLNQKLSRNEFMQDAIGSFAPVIILLSDGEPTDNYRKELDALKSNNWFKAGIKIAIAIGDDANQDVLKEFTGNIECVLIAHNPDMLKKMIRFVSVRASQIGSKSSAAGAGDKDKQTQIGEQLKEELPSVVDTGTSPLVNVDAW
ncbi:MAG: VWA domain-containing protein [Dysgonamonadaceae bacterium]|jgi:uncharacterized protein YegL|nr:VWA domain-containing protein [Dysgonamonadaceae bacterium]